MGPLILDTIGRILISEPALWVLTRWQNLGRSVFNARKLCWIKGGILFCRQIFFQAVLTLFLTVLADMRGTFW